MLVSEHLHAERPKSQMGRELDRGHGSWDQRGVRTEKENTHGRKSDESERGGLRWNGASGPP